MLGFLLIGLSTIVIFFISFFVGRFYFREPNRALVFGIALAAMFFITYNLREDAGPTTQLVAATAVSPTSPAPAVVSTIHNVSTLCSTSASAETVPPGMGALDIVRAGSSSVASGQSVPASEKVIFAGWAVDWREHGLAKAVCLTVDGKIVGRVRATYGVTREDVGVALRDPALAPSGFGLEVAAHALSPGEHVFQVIVASNGNAWAKLGKPFLIRFT